MAEPAAARGGSVPDAPIAQAPWLVAGAVAVAYASAFGGSFQFDDWNVIVRDPRVQSLSAWWASMPGIRPLLKGSYAANHASGLGLAGFHAVNVALHALNALLVHALFLRAGRRVEPDSPWLPEAALLGALLFALHPAQTEAVTYVSGRSTSLAAAFALGSVLTWVAGREGPRPWLGHGLSPLLFACALGAKEYAVVLPAALLLLEATDRRRPFSWRAALSATAVHWAVLACVLAAFLAAPAYRWMISTSLGLRPPWENLLTHVHALAYLAGQVVRLDRLNADPMVAAAREVTPTLVVEAVALLALLGAGIASLRRRAALALGVLWFLLWLPPAGWWLPRPEPANERQLYLSLAGPAWLAGRWMAPWVARGGARLAAVVALLACLGAGSAWRNTVYGDEVRFWTDVIRKSPHHARAHNNLGYALAAGCRRAEAQAAFARALEIDPQFARAAVNLGLLREGASLGPDVGEARCPDP